jgi:hypothetical protein
MPTIINEYKGWCIINDADAVLPNVTYYMGHCCTAFREASLVGNSYYCQECKVKMPNDVEEHFKRVWLLIRPQ